MNALCLLPGVREETWGKKCGGWREGTLLRKLREILVRFVLNMRHHPCGGWTAWDRPSPAGISVGPVFFPCFRIYVSRWKCGRRSNPWSQGRTGHTCWKAGAGRNILVRDQGNADDRIHCQGEKMWIPSFWRSWFGIMGAGRRGAEISVPESAGQCSICPVWILSITVRTVKSFNKWCSTSSFSGQMRPLYLDRYLFHLEGDRPITSLKVLLKWEMEE